MRAIMLCEHNRNQYINHLWFISCYFKFSFRFHFSFTLRWYLLEARDERMNFLQYILASFFRFGNKISVMDILFLLFYQTQFMHVHSHLSGWFSQRHCIFFRFRLLFVLLAHLLWCCFYSHSLTHFSYSFFPCFLRHSVANSIVSMIYE